MKQKTLSKENLIKIKRLAKSKNTDIKFTARCYYYYIYFKSYSAMAKATGCNRKWISKTCKYYESHFLL